LAAEEISERSGKASYQLTDPGKSELAGGPQDPAAVFTLSGAAINELLRHAGATPATAIATPAVSTDAVAAEEPVPDAPPASPIYESADAPAPAPTPAPTIAAVSDDALIDEARELLRERHGHTGLVPIFELRRRIKAKFGDLSASHAELDGRLKRLRREYRLRLVSISDRSRATPEELSESVPGEEEMFFYVGELR
jgi:hypothetical protein